MAYNPLKIFPIDTQTGIAVGINIPFNAPAVFSSNYLTKDAIKNNLINFFLTERNERYLNPIFGGGLRYFLFEQIDNGNIEYLKTDIQSKVGLYFPNVILNEINIDQYPDENMISLNIYYSIKDTGITDEIQINFNI